MKRVSRPVCRLTCQIPRLLSSAVRSVLEGTDLLAGFVQPGRTVQLRERSRRFLPAPVAGLEESLCNVFHLHVPPEAEGRVLERIIGQAGLEMADRGSIYSEAVEQVLPEGAGPVPEGAAKAEEREEAGSRRRFPLVTELTGIRCILPRGLGDAVARLALELGTCVPAVTFGTGTGWRDRLVEGARLNQPGKGFVYLYPIGRGLLNIRLRLGGQRHAAGINQLVTAVDSLWGGTGWRRRFPAEEQLPPRQALRFQHNLLELTLICREGRTDELVQAAMEAGSGGATTERVVRIGVAAPRPEVVPAGRELTTLVVPARRRERVLDALQGAGLFDEESGGSLYVGPAPLAYSYTRRRTLDARAG